MNETALNSSPMRAGAWIVTLINQAVLLCLFRHSGHMAVFENLEMLLAELQSWE